jgi:hypothetical protein
MATINYDFLTQQHAIVFLDWDLGSKIFFFDQEKDFIGIKAIYCNRSF